MVSSKLSVEIIVVSGDFSGMTGLVGMEVVEVVTVTVQDHPLLIANTVLLAAGILEKHGDLDSGRAQGLEVRPQELLDMPLEEQLEGDKANQFGLLAVQEARAQVPARHPQLSIIRAQALDPHPEDSSIMKATSTNNVHLTNVGLEILD